MGKEIMKTLNARAGDANGESMRRKKEKCARIDWKIKEGLEGIHEGRK